MKSSFLFKVVVFILFATLQAQAKKLDLDKIKLPPGFKISVLVSEVKGARSMTFGKKGTLFIGTKEEGNVYAVGSDNKVHTLAKGLNMPNGVAFRDGTLYVAEVNRILKFEKIEDRLANPGKPQVVYSDFSKDKNHGWKFIAFGPDGKLYVPVGAPCNICEPKDPFGSITRMSLEGKLAPEVFVRGVRNTVGFDWHPVTGELWFTDNGRDMLGDDTPFDELNRAPSQGLHFGYPYCHSGKILDPEFGKNKKCEDFVAPEQNLGPHVASLGMRFYTGSMFPAEYKNQVFIAEHGSWNRSAPLGYRITLVSIGKDGHATGYKTFAEGWLQKSEPWGRPVDVQVKDDGSLLVSDDLAGVIYQIRYSK